MSIIPFNKPYLTGKEIDFIKGAHRNSQLAGDGYYTNLCSKWLEQNLDVQTALLTNSGTAALEMAAILLEIKPGDEIIMPSYTFVSTANAFVLRGGVPIFADIRPDTANINESLISSLITPKTKAIVVVHYAGVGCNMDMIMNLAREHNLIVIEDAAHAILSRYKQRKLGSIGDLGCLSFHETKNITCGEGGALLINNPKYIERARTIRNKGTNRYEFENGLIKKYSWVDIGSSFLPGELNAAFLWAQMIQAEYIIRNRIMSWETYHDGLKSLEQSGNLRRPYIPSDCKHNAHMYYLLLPSEISRNEFIAYMRSCSINCTFHYTPLHNSKAAIKYQLPRTTNEMHVTESVSQRLVRLPLWVGVDPHLEKVIDCTKSFFLINDYQ